MGVKEAYKSTVTLSIVVCLVYLNSAEGQVFLDEPIGWLGYGPHGISKMAFSPDGSLLAIGVSCSVRMPHGSIYKGSGIWLYDTKDLTRLAVMEGHTGDIHSVEFSLDGRVIASAGGDIRLWDALTRELIAVLGEGSSATFSPDGRIIAWTGVGIHLWGVEEKREIGVLETQANAVAFSPDGWKLASADDKIVHLWDVEEKREIATLPHEYPVSSVTFSPDGRKLASAGDEMVYLWDVEEKREIATPPHEYPVTSIAFSPDGSILASTQGEWELISGFYSGNGNVSLWNATNGEDIGMLQTRDVVSSLLFSPDGKILVASSEDGRASAIEVWDVEGREKVQVLGAYGWGYAHVTSFALSPDGRMLAWADSDRDLYLYDLDEKKIAANATTEGHTESIHSLAFSPDGKTLASGAGEECWLIACSKSLWDATVRLWDVAEMKQTDVLRMVGAVYSLAFSPDGKTLASGCGALSKVVHLWDVENQTTIAALCGYNNGVDSVAFSPDGMKIASSGWYGTVRLWSVEEGKEEAVFEIHDGNLLDVTFNPDGEAIALSSHDDNTVRLWDVKEQKEIAVFEGYSHRTTLSPDGRILALGNPEGRTVHLWDVRGEIEIAVLEGTWSPVAFSPDGRILATSNLTDITLWDIEEGSKIAVIQGSQGPLVFSPDGNMLASCCETTGVILLWDISRREMTPSSVEAEEKSVLSWGELKSFDHDDTEGLTSVLQNYPNPFNPETWIPFELVQESEVILRIYDAKGSLIREISLGRKQAGSYIQRSKAIYWDGRNGSGERMASGAYFYHFRAGDYTETRKMILAK